jgi:hypothetical protein
MHGYCAFERNLARYIYLMNVLLGCARMDQIYFAKGIIGDLKIFRCSEGKIFHQRRVTLYSNNVTVHGSKCLKKTMTISGFKRWKLRT